MLEIYPLTEDNIKEVAKVSGRREQDLQMLYEDGLAANKAVKIWVEKPDVPEGFGTGSYR